MRYGSHSSFILSLARRYNIGTSKCIANLPNYLTHPLGQWLPNRLYTHQSDLQSKDTSFWVNIRLQTHQSDLKEYLSQVVLPSHHPGAPC